MSRIFTTSVASVYPHYVTKVEKKGRTTSELHQVIEWLTGFDGTTPDVISTSSSTSWPRGARGRRSCVPDLPL